MMEGGQVMVVMIVAIVMVASIIRARYGYGRYGRMRNANPEVAAEEHAENLRLRDEVKELKERMKVLERIAVDKENSLSRQIEELRDR
jgi:cell division protein FtsB